MKLAEFQRRFYTDDMYPLCVGSGAIGGKAAGLVDITEAIEADATIKTDSEVTISIPRMVVIATDLFDEFMEQNRLYDAALSKIPDDRIAEEFQNAHLPVRLVGDLRSIAREVHMPLAVRSSSMLEDALKHPFAGVYATKMIPNNQPNEDQRFQKLVQAIKLVYASTFFEGARRYAQAIGKSSSDEKMAIIIQEVVGARHNDRFYPDISGVARSHNYYPFGHAQPADGVVNLALGLGKAIVDGEPTWSYCPAYPMSPPPFNGISDLLKCTQNNFWAVNMSSISEYHPTQENEFLARGLLSDAEYDNTLHRIASTYNAPSDRIEMGIGANGPRVINFAPALGLNESPLNTIIRNVLAVCEKSTGANVEIEFAITFNKSRGFDGRFGLLQVRPTASVQSEIEIDAWTSESPDSVVFSTRVMGHGMHRVIEDIVFVRPDTFEPRNSLIAAQEIGRINSHLQKEGRPYLLIGYGRWGTTDPWRGIPVVWDQISGAKVIVEAEMEEARSDFSQGSHFFHNMTSFDVSYFHVPSGQGFKLDMEWIERQQVISEHKYTKHVRVDSPLTVKVDGRNGRGVVHHD